jgi:hypothetical protein
VSPVGYEFYYLNVMETRVFHVRYELYFWMLYADPRVSCEVRIIFLNVILRPACFMWGTNCISECYMQTRVSPVRYEFYFWMLYGDPRVSCQVRIIFLNVICWPACFMWGTNYISECYMQTRVSPVRYEFYFWMLYGDTCVFSEVRITCRNVRWRPVYILWVTK